MELSVTTQIFLAVIAALPALAMAAMAFAFRRSDTLTKVVADTANQEQRIKHVEDGVDQIKDMVGEIRADLPKTYISREQATEILAPLHWKIDALREQMQAKK